MAEVTIYHNPRCSKSRQTLALLEENKIDVRIVNYLEAPPTADELKEIISLLSVSAFDIVRTGEAEYKEAGIDASSSDESVINAIVNAPKLMQRPIVVGNQEAIIGRPPENVMRLID